MKSDDNRLLDLLLEQAGISQPLRTALATYGNLVLEVGRTFNITGAKTAEKMLSQLLDSLTVVPHVAGPYVDVGSGAGFPAIPVALATGLPVTLIEATLKKARFLETVLERMGLAGDVFADRAEVAGRQPRLRERFASGTARAVASPAAMAELLVPFIGRGGIAICQLGSLESGKRTLEYASSMLGAKVESEQILPEGRRLVLLRKTSATPARFPRQNGIPTKRPLCT